MFMEWEIDAAEYLTGTLPDRGPTALSGLQQDGDGGVGLIQRRLLIVRRHQRS